MQICYFVADLTLEKSIYIYCATLAYDESEDGDQKNDGDGH